MRIAIPTLFVTAVAALAQPAPNTLTKQEKAAGWILLFDGKSLAGWHPEGAAEWMAENGAITTKPGPYGWLRSDGQFGDYQLKLEFRACENCNSGVFLRSATTGEPHKTGYELQIWTGNEKYPTGSLVNHATAHAKFKGDVWNEYDVTLRGDHFVIKLNGEKVLDIHDSKSKSGHIGLQSNKDKIEFRNLKLRRL